MHINKPTQKDTLPRSSQFSEVFKHHWDLTLAESTNPSKHSKLAKKSADLLEQANFFVGNETTKSDTLLSDESMQMEMDEFVGQGSDEDEDKPLANLVKKFASKVHPNIRDYGQLRKRLRTENVRGLYRGFRRPF